MVLLFWGISFAVDWVAVKLRHTYSIIIPCYNRADKIKPTLLSVKSQTYSDFECIVVDDGSTDGLGLSKVIAELSDSRFKYLRRENGGGSAARNTGIDAATGSIVAFLDSDDIWLPSKLEKFEKARVALPVGDWLLYSKILVDRGVEKMWVKPARGLLDGERVDDYLLCERGMIQCSTIVMPADLAKRIRFDELLPYNQDADFAMRVYFSGAGFYLVDDPLTIWMDQEDPGRITHAPKYQPLIEWSERMRPSLSKKSYFAFRGWHLARSIRPHDLLFATKLYFSGLMHGAFGVRLACISFLQIYLPRSLYRKIADTIVTLAGRD